MADQPQPAPNQGAIDWLQNVAHGWFDKLFAGQELKSAAAPEKPPAVRPNTAADYGAAKKGVDEYMAQKKRMDAAKPAPAAGIEVLSKKKAGPPK